MRRTVILGLGLAALLLSALYRPVQAEEAPFAFVGTIKYPSATSAWVNIVLDPGVSRGFSFEEGFANVAVFDLRSNNLEKTLTLPGPINDGSTGGGGFTTDLVHHRLFLAAPGGFPFEADACNTGALAKETLHVVHTDTLVTQQIKIPCPNPVEGTFVEGLWYDTAADKLYVLTLPSQTSKTIANGNVPVPGYVMRIDPTTGAADPKWPAVRVAPPCTQFANGYPVPQGLVRRVGDKVIGICNANQGTQNYGFTIPLMADGSPNTQAVSTQPIIGGILGASFDDAGGLLLLTTAVQGNAIGTYVLDRDFNFLGTVAAGDTTIAARIKAIGVDQQRGRLYEQNRNGLIVSDIRHTPLPSGLSYTELRYKHNPPPEVNGTVIPVDPATHRIYLPDPDGKQWLVYEDRLPDLPVYGASDPDQGTSDIPEVAGKTAANYSASANAFGVSWISRGGPTKPVSNTDLWCQAQPALSQRQFFGGECVEDVFLTPGDRAWFAGRVSKMNLSNAAADVSATPVHIADSPSQQDMIGAEQSADGALNPKVGEQQINGGQYVNGGKPLSSTDNEFPGSRAQCRDFDQGGEDKNSSSDLGDAIVKCHSDDATVSADVNFHGANLANPGIPISVSQTVTNVSSHKDPQKGLVTDATAIARGIRIGEFVYIGEISTRAQSWANGRPGKAGATFTRTVQGYSAPDYKCSAECDVYKVVASLNSQLQAARIEVQAPEPDGTYFPYGSPGGYQALVTKMEIDRISDSTVNNDYRDTVSGLKLVFYSDGNLGPSRQIFDFAGVHVESHYGVYALPADTPFTGGTDTPIASVDDSTGGDLGAIVPDSVAAPVPTYNVPGPKVIERIVKFVGEAARQAVKAAWHLLVSQPAAGSRLALAMMILASPIYMVIRRRHFIRAVLSPFGRNATNP